VEAIVAEWKNQPGASPALNEIIHFDQNPLDEPFELFYRIIDSEYFLTKNIDVGKTQALSPHCKALYSLAILVSNYIYTLNYPEIFKHYPNKTLELTFETIKEAKGRVSSVIMDILDSAVIGSHLSTSWRKIRQGQKSSLRFYTAGEFYYPTMIDKVDAGISNDRLSNVMLMLSDLGYLQNMTNIGYSLTEKGTLLQKKLEQML
jgi:hypothetical protein